MGAFDYKNPKKGGKEVAKKLRNLKVTKVDFVDAGANPNANVLLYKSQSGVPGGNQGVQSGLGVPEEPRTEGILKRFISAVGKAVGLKPEEIDATIEEIAKGSEAETFGEKMYEVTRRRIMDEMWDLCYALQSSLCSIVCDDSVEDNAQELMMTSLSEFEAVMTGAIEQWATGKTSNVIRKAAVPASEAELDYMKSVRTRVDDFIAKAEAGEELKGEEVDMGKIDTSKMTPAEKAFLEDIEKRYGEGAGTVTEGQESPVAKAAPQVVPATETEDIYKGLHPAVAEELRMLRKRADEAEEQELTGIAKKYEIIGKKSEELLPVLKSLKAAGGAAYDNMIAILDASVEAVNKSSMFSEIGKSGGNGDADSDAWTKIEKKADEIMQSTPTMTRAAAIDTVCQQNPQLVHEYETGR